MEDVYQRIKKNKRSQHSQNWITFSSNRSQNKSSYTPYFMMECSLSKKLNLTFEISNSGLNKMKFFICYFNGKDILHSDRFEKASNRKSNTKAKCFKLLKDHSEEGVRMFLKYICTLLEISENKQVFFIIRCFEHQFHFEKWKSFI